MALLKNVKDYKQGVKVRFDFRYIRGGGGGGGYLDEMLPFDLLKIEVISLGLKKISLF